MTVSQNFPSIAPSLSLNFASSRTLDPRITFTRTSSATCVGPNGLLRVVPVNSPRFDHNPETGESLGLLVEEQRTNLLLRSEEFDSASWAKANASVSPNASLAPSGSLSADLYVPSIGVAIAGNGNFHTIRQAITLVSGTVYTLSFYLKAAGYNVLRFGLSSQPNLVNNYSDITVNLATQSVTQTLGTGSITNVGDGWYRVTATGTATSTTGFAVCVVADGGTADGTSGLFLWGAQLEEGAFPTSYIPTTTSTATRTADNARIIGSNLESWFNSNEGTFLINHQWNYFSSISINPIFAVSTNGGPSGINLFNVISGNGLEYPATSNYVKITTSSFSKYGLTYNTSSRATILNGGPVVEDANGFTLLSTVNRLSIGSDRFFAVNGVKTIQQLTYYPQRLSNSQLITLTK